MFLFYLSKLSNALKTDVVKKDVCNAKIKIPDITNLANTTTALNAKINEVKNKIPNITSLPTSTALSAIENEIHNVSNLVKKTDYNTKISKIENKITTDHDHDKYITTQEFRKFPSENFAARLAQVNIAGKSDVAAHPACNVV